MQAEMDKIKQNEEMVIEVLYNNFVAIMSTVLLSYDSFLTAKSEVAEEDVA